MLVARSLRPDHSLKLAVRCALLSLALSSGVAPLTLAATPTPLDAVASRTYQIAPGPLGMTLSTVAVEAGIALSFQPSLTEGLTSPGLSGTYSAEEAISRLLVGSGL